MSLILLDKRSPPLMEHQKIPNINRDCINANIYVDYENIVELLKRYGKNPLEIDFFQLFYVF